MNASLYYKGRIFLPARLSTGETQNSGHNSVLKTASLLLCKSAASSHEYISVNSVEGSFYHAQLTTEYYV